MECCAARAGVHMKWKRCKGAKLAQAGAWLLSSRCCPSGSGPAAEHHSDLCISM